jgi:hypothetical protein
MQRVARKEVVNDGAAAGSVAVAWPIPDNYLNTGISHKSAEKKMSKR